MVAQLPDCARALVVRKSTASHKRNRAK
jgi:hypothetical protein